MIGRKRKHQTQRAAARKVTTVAARAARDATRLAETIAMPRGARNVVAAAVAGGLAKRMARSTRRRAGSGSKDPSISALRKRRRQFQSGTLAIASSLAAAAAGQAAKAVEAAASVVGAALARAGVPVADEDAEDSEVVSEDSTHSNDDESASENDEMEKAITQRIRILSPFHSGQPTSAYVQCRVALLISF